MTNIPIFFRCGEVDTPTVKIPPAKTAQTESAIMGGSQ